VSNSLFCSGRVTACIALVLLAGCTTFSVDGGFDDVESAARQRLGADLALGRPDRDEPRTASLVKERLTKPLDVDDAVQIALLNNPGLKAFYAELGIAEAELVQAGRIGNPRFTYLRTSHGDQRSIEWSLTFPIIDLLTMPLRTRIEAQRFAQAKLELARRVIEVASETRRAWYQTVAADETTRYLQQVKESAEAGAELARRMARAGNMSRLAQMREQVFYAEVVAQLARARHAALSEREHLTRLMGLYGEDVRFTLPERLPDLPQSARKVEDAEATAVTQRLDILVAKRDTEGLAASLGLTRATRFINVLEVGPAATKEDPEPWKRGFEISVDVPLFDWGSARIAKAEAQYMRAVNRVAEIAVNARSEVRESYSAYATAFDTARHYRDEIVPLRKKISDENVLRYSGMLISVFELLADAREQVASVNAYIESLRDYWVADANLQTALTGGSPGTMERSAAAIMTANPRRGH
jgi:outer membrane protein TolC